MKCEGLGLIAPKGVMVKIARWQIDELYEAAKTIEAKYSRRRDSWGKGLISNPTFYGMLGEQAVCNLLNNRLRPEHFGLPLLAVDTNKYEGGDGGIDIPLLSKRIQVKNRRGGRGLLIRSEQEIRKPDMGYVRRLKDIRYDIAIKVACPKKAAINPPHDDLREALIEGWVTVDDILEYGERRSAERGDHHNMYIDDKYLRHPEDLVLQFKTTLEGVGK